MDRLALNRLGSFLFESDIFMSPQGLATERESVDLDPHLDLTLSTQPTANSHHLLLISNHEECSTMMVANGTLSV